MDTSKTEPIGQVLFEFKQVGGQMRVAAIHADSGVEVIVVAPTTATQTQMQQLAYAKLKRRMQRENPV